MRGLLAQTMNLNRCAQISFDASIGIGSVSARAHTRHVTATRCAKRVSYLVKVQVPIPEELLVNLHFERVECHGSLRKIETADSILSLSTRLEQLW